MQLLIITFVSGYEASKGGLGGQRCHCVAWGWSCTIVCGGTLLGQPFRAVTFDMPWLVAVKAVPLTSIRWRWWPASACALVRLLGAFVVDAGIFANPRVVRRGDACSHHTLIVSHLG